MELYGSPDGGKTIVPVKVAADGSLYAILDADVTVDVGEVQMLGSSDGGTTWYPVKVDSSGLVAIRALTSADVVTADLASGSNIVGKVGIDQTTPGATNGVNVNAVSAGQLAYQGLPRVSATCTLAGTDYAFGANIPAGTVAVILYCAAHFQVAVGEATSAAVGADMPGGMPESWPVKAADVAAGKALHVQSDTAGAVVYATYLAA